MLTPWRRHTPKCPHGHKGRAYTKCACPIWADGTLNGERFRESLGLRDWQRAIKTLAAFESPDAPPWKPLQAAIDGFLQHHAYLEDSTKRKYGNVLNHLADFAKTEKIEAVSELGIDQMDSYRAKRELSKTTSTKELQTLRQFFGFCMDRKWVAENVAKRIKAPANAHSKPVEPYKPEEMARIIAACDAIGRTSYERLRARAMVLLLRYTALSISDVATLARDRVRDGEILLRRQKTGGLVFLPVPDQLQAALDALPATRDSDENPSNYFWNEESMSRRCVVGVAERTLSAVCKRSGVAHAHAHRFRQTIATEILAKGGTEQDAADVLGNSPAVIRKHYAKWNVQRQDRIKSLMQAVHSGTFLAQTEKRAAIN